MDQGTERCLLTPLMDAVAGARRTPGRLETGGVPSKPPASTLVSVPSGVIFYALPRQPYFPSLSLRRLRLRVAAQASRTSYVGHVLRPVAAGVSLSAVHIFSILAGEIPEEALPGATSTLSS